jgi:hypothetical protein
METPPNKFLYDPGPIKSFEYPVRHERAMDGQLNLVNRSKLIRARTCPQDRLLGCSGRPGMRPA